MTIRKLMTRYDKIYVMPMVDDPQLPGYPWSLSGGRQSSSFIIPSSTPSHPAEVDIWITWPLQLSGSRKRDNIMHLVFILFRDNINSTTTIEYALWTLGRSVKTKILSISENLWSIKTCIILVNDINILIEFEISPSYYWRKFYPKCSIKIKLIWNF